MKFKLRLTVVTLILFLWVTIGITTGNNTANTSGGNSVKSKNSVRPESTVESEDTASGSGKLVVTMESAEDKNTTLPEFAGDFDADIKRWMTITWGEDAIEIIRQVRTSGKVYAPAVGMMDSFLKGPSINDPNWKPLKTSDLSFGTHMAVITAPDGTQLKQKAAYTDLALLSNKEMIHEQSAYEWLKDALYMEESDGIVINPKTRFMREEISPTYFSLNRHGVAELLGFLEVQDEGKDVAFHELANRAYEQKKYFQVLYYWGRSYRTPRTNDDWKKAESAKLHTYFELNYPSSQERARSELEWMTKNHPAEEFTKLVFYTVSKK